MNQINKQGELNKTHAQYFKQHIQDRQKHGQTDKQTDRQTEIFRGGAQIKTVFA